MIKDKRVAFVIYVVLFVVLWKIFEMIFSGSGINASTEIDIDIFVPLILAIVTGYLFFIAQNVNINDELKFARETEGAVIVDVREADEYAQGHIPGAINVPADNLETIQSIVIDKDTPIFSYCLRGSRSRGAAKAMKAMGYTHVINMGGINKYKGELER